ncbi:MAG: hypothetical protein WC284_17630 [Candidimonas sp.]|jgi:uncharacterized membrane protein
MNQAFQPEGTGLTMRQLTHLIYALFALGVLTAGFAGMAVIAAMILLYLKRADAAGTVYAAHFDWLAGTFWWGLLWMVLSAMATVIFIGWLTGLAALIWIVYRLLKGWLALLASAPPMGNA